MLPLLRQYLNNLSVFLCAGVAVYTPTPGISPSVIGGLGIAVLCEGCCYVVEVVGPH